MKGVLSTLLLLAMIFVQSYALSVDSFTPAKSEVSVATNIHIIGSGFEVVAPSRIAVDLCGINCSDLKVASDNEITCTVTANAIKKNTACNVVVSVVNDTDNTKESASSKSTLEFDGAVQTDSQKYMIMGMAFLGVLGLGIIGHFVINCKKSKKGKTDILLDDHLVNSV